MSRIRFTTERGCWLHGIDLPPSLLQFGDLLAWYGPSGYSRRPRYSVEWSACETIGGAIGHTAGLARAEF